MREQQKQNIILILADDLGYECLGCYGGESYNTPNLDAMAASGTRFTHAYALPLCTPTRVQIMTGKYNFRNWKAFGILDPDEKTFGHYMPHAGYKTCVTGKWQLWSYNPPNFEPEWRGQGMLPENAGFDEFFLWHAGHTEDKGSRYADPLIFDNNGLRQDTKGRYGPDLYVEYLLDFVKRYQNQPFFVYYPMALTHGPFMPTPDSLEWIENRHKSNVGNFKYMVEYTDKIVGQIMNGLDDLGLCDNTLVMFIGDNGSPTEVVSMLGDRPFRGGKGKSTDAGTRVPLIASWGNNETGTSVCNDLVDCSDFLPTMMEIVGTSLPSQTICDGRSFLPQLVGKRPNPREWIYAWHNPLPGWAKEGYYLQEWAQDQTWKLYDDGLLYNLVIDVLEEYPIEEDTEESKTARKNLQSVLNRMKQQQ